eukprot:CAMPEP_0176438008 /NCGR_PEP_ID=MMETSP0127-20121128/18998_1 /TAXON_ID=938130 /ORGANISM="Platyophrya macrostoma, Strain WH" /LENGTH=240 /DNA_ID=CAMNT_0017821817 /DNA_START=35 /DNA_END=757 /DNA_ORIENTATION=+
MRSDIDAGGLEGLKFYGERSHHRNVFLRKVFAISSIELLFAFISVSFVNAYVSFDSWVGTYYGITIGTFILQALLMFLVYVRRPLFRGSPANILLFILFTVLLSWNLIYIESLDNTPQVLMIVTHAVLTNLALLIYTLTTKKDLTYLGATIYIIGSALVGYELFLIASDIPFMSLVVIALSVVVYGFYLISGTQYLIVGQSSSAEMEDPVVGSIVIYDDILLIAFRLVEALSRVFKKHRY